MLARARALQARALPKGPADALRQVALFAAAYYGYRLVRGMVDGRAATAFENARNLIDVERTLGIFVEPTMQAWTSPGRERSSVKAPRPDRRRSSSLRGKGCPIHCFKRSAG